MKSALLRIGLIVVLMTLTVSASLGCIGQPSATPKPTLRIAIQPVLSPLWVIKEQRILEEKYGYAVQWIDATHAAAVMEALAAKAVDIGEAGAPPSIQGRERGGEFWTVAAVVGGVAYAVAKEGRGIKKLEDLKGKRIAFPGKASWQYVVLRLAFDKGRFSEDDVTLYKAEFPDMPILLEKGDIDAFVGVDPFGSVVETKGVGNVIFTAGDFLPQREGQAISGFTLVYPEFAEKNASAIADLMKAQQSANDWIRADSDRAAKFFAEQVYKGSMPAEVISNSLRKGYTTYFADITPVAKQVQELVEVMNKYGMTKISDPAAFVADFVHPEFAEKALKR